MSLKTVIPVLVPDSLSRRGKWMGPILNLQAPGVAVTWGMFAPPASIAYLTYDMAEQWEAKDIDWQGRSMENLERMSEVLAPQSIAGSDGRPAALILNHEDGLGPSRLLLNGAIEEIFPDGYEVAIPDRILAVVVSRRINGTQRTDVEAFMKRCYAAAKEPFVGKFFDPDLLQV